MPKKLEKPLPIDRSLEGALSFLKGKVLLRSNTAELLIVGDFTVETVETERKGFITGRRNVRSQRCLTEIDLYGWNPDLGFWGTYSSETAKFILTLYDLAAMRESFEKKVLAPLEALGVDMTAHPERTADSERQSPYLYIHGKK